MSGRRSRRKRDESAAAAPARGGAAPSTAPLPPARRRLYLAITLLLPLLLLAAIEGVLRLTYAGHPLFVRAPGAAGGGYLIANPRVAARYFPAERVPPAPPADPFALDKPERGFRVFVLGESSTAGFPYPRNGTFSRVLRDALRDVLPGDSVEVVNLGIAATNSYTLVDLVDEVLAHEPDAVLVYGGHNEYYGALGVGSASGGLALPPVLKRAYLRLLDLRTVLALRDGLARLRGAGGDETAPVEASLMEALARDPRIELGSDAYERGVRQYESNLTVLLSRLRAAEVPVLVASVGSNLRDQPPLVSPANGMAGGADSTFAAATAALATGDTSGARALFERARDLDVVRFRASGEFADVVRRVAERTGATYVPAAEALSAAAPGGIPGRTLFLEHVHPTQHGQVVLAQAFYAALREQAFLGRAAQPERLQTWAAYEQAMALTPFDVRVAHHALQALMHRWPFVPVDEQRDYRGTYRPVGLVDSLAFLSSRGGLPWGVAKAQLGEHYLRAGHADSAAAEFRGLVRDAPQFELSHRYLGRALLAAGRHEEAEAALRQAMALRPSAEAALLLARLQIARSDTAAARPLLQQAERLAADDPGVLYQLSLAYGLTRDIPRARAAALRLRAVAPGYPGLADWLGTLGVR